MGYKFRTPGPWGPGQLVDLDPIDIDNNFWQAIQDIQVKAVQGVGISNIVVSGNQFTVVLTDHTLLGPYTLPMVSIIFRGEWQPDTYYPAGNILTHGGSTYMVTWNHTSAATFDPHANDGHAHDYYGLLLENPALTLPTGGAPGQIPVKNSIIDYDTIWQWNTFEGLHDVLPSPGPVSGDLVTWNGSKFTYTPQDAIVAAPQALRNLSDVLASPSPNNGDLVYWNGSAFSYLPQATITGGTSFSTTALLTGQPLVYDSSLGAFTNDSKVDLPCYINGNVSGTVEIDRLNGEVQRLQLVGDSTLNLLNWPSYNQFARLVLRIDNNGHALTWPGNAKWPGGIAPAISPNGTDIIIFTSFDGGNNVYANIVGQAYA